MCSLQQRLFSRAFRAHALAILAVSSLDRREHLSSSSELPILMTSLGFLVGTTSLFLFLPIVLWLAAAELATIGDTAARGLRTSALLTAYGGGGRPKDSSRVEPLGIVCVSCRASKAFRFSSAAFMLIKPLRRSGSTFSYSV